MGRLTQRLSGSLIMDCSVWGVPWTIILPVVETIHGLARHELRGPFRDSGSPSYLVLGAI